MNNSQAIFIDTISAIATEMHNDAFKYIKEAKDDIERSIIAKNNSDKLCEIEYSRDSLILAVRAGEAAYGAMKILRAERNEAEKLSNLVKNDKEKKKIYNKWLEKTLIASNNGEKLNSKIDDIIDNIEFIIKFKVDSTEPGDYISEFFDNIKLAMTIISDGVKIKEKVTAARQEAIKEIQKEFHEACVKKRKPEEIEIDNMFENFSIKNNGKKVQKVVNKD